MKDIKKFFIQSRNAKKTKLNKFWKNLMERYPFMGYAHEIRYLSIMGKDTRVKINSPRLIKKNLIKYHQDLINNQ